MAIDQSNPNPSSNTLSIPAEGWADASQATLDSYNMASVADALASSGAYLSSIAGYDTTNLENMGVWVEGEFISVASAMDDNGFILFELWDKWIWDFTDKEGWLEGLVKDITSKWIWDTSDKEAKLEKTVKENMDAMERYFFETAQAVTRGLDTWFDGIAEELSQLFVTSIGSFFPLVTSVIKAFSGWIWDELAEKL